MSLLLSLLDRCFQGLCGVNGVVLTIWCALCGVNGVGMYQGGAKDKTG